MSSAAHKERYPEDWGDIAYLEERTKEIILERTAEQPNWQDILPGSIEPLETEAPLTAPNRHHARNFVIAVVGGAALIAIGISAGQNFFERKHQRKAAA